jgi:NADH dehydrogenase FAD-containing subunit
MKRFIKGETLKPYKPALPVTVIPVGADWAVAEWGKLHAAGRLGWLLRHAANWIGFKDVEPWWEATEQFFTEFGAQEDCPTCKVALMQQPEQVVSH